MIVSVGEVSWNKMFPEKAVLTKFVQAYYKALGTDNLCFSRCQRGLIRRAAETNKAMTTFNPRVILARIILFAKGKTATSSGRIQYCLHRVGFNCENIITIHRNHYAFNKRNMAEDHSE